MYRNRKHVRHNSFMMTNKYKNGNNNKIKKKIIFACIYLQLMLLSKIYVFMCEL